MYRNLTQIHEKLKIDNDAATLRIGGLENDSNYMRTQYQNSSSQVVQLGEDNRKFKVEIARLKKSLQLGVEQVQLIGQAKENRLMEELDKARMELEIIKEMSRRTNDEEIRSRASRTTELEAKEARRLQQNAIFWPSLKALNTMPVSASPVHSHSEKVAIPLPAMLDMQLMEDDESEDEDFQASTSDNEGSSDSTSDDDIPASTAPLQTTDGTLLPYMAEVARENAQITVYKEEIVQQDEAVTGSAASHCDTSATTARMVVGEEVSLLTVNILDTSGETTEATSLTTTTSNSNKPLDGSQDLASYILQDTDSSQSQQDSKSTMDTEDILELDSSILDTQEAYVCLWGQTTAEGCKATFDSLPVSTSFLRPPNLILIGLNAPGAFFSRK